MRAMENEIPVRLLKPVPTLLTRRLCGRDASVDLALHRRQPLAARFLFALGMSVVGAIDALARCVAPGFSLSRMFTRALGYRLVTRFLMDETRPLRLPGALLRQVHAAAAGWRHDPRAPHWLNRVEARLAGHGLPAKH